MNVAAILAKKGRGVVTIHPDQALREGVALLAKHKIGALVVVDQAGQVVGILSERDITRALAEDEQIFSRPVSTLMTPKPITGVPQDDLLVVANTMTEKRFRHLPIVDKGRLIGIVSIGDVLKAQRDQYSGEVDTLHAQILATEV